MNRLQDLAAGPCGTLEPWRGSAQVDGLAILPPQAPAAPVAAFHDEAGRRKTVSLAVLRPGR